MLVIGGLYLGDVTDIENKHLLMSLMSCMSSEYVVDERIGVELDLSTRKFVMMVVAMVVLLFHP